MVLEEHSDLELAGIRFQISMFEEALANDSGDTEALRYLAHAYTVIGRSGDGLNADRRLVELLPRDPRVRYNLACYLALADNTEEAFGALHEACDLGFTDVNLMRKDKDLDSLRNDARYIEVEARLTGS